MDSGLGSGSPGQDNEPSLLEYARMQNICVDYTTELVSFLKTGVHSNETFDQSLCDLPDSSITNAIPALTRERLAVSKETALLLKAVYSLEEHPSASYFGNGGNHPKQELPVLQTDHDLDLLSFASVTPLDWKHIKIPSEIIIEQDDEGLEWPTRYLSIAKRCDAQAKAEKLVVSRHALVFLQEAIRDAYARAIRPITPPLLPLSPLQVPYVPSSPTNHLPLLSDSSDSVRAEACSLHEQIMAADSLTRKESDSSDSMLLDVVHPSPFSPLSEARASTPLKRKAEDLKVEGPLTPPILSTSPMKKLKSVSFATNLDEYISYEPWRRDSDTHTTSEDFDELFRDIEPLAEHARRKVRNERLSDADTTARVSVPDMELSLPVAPWLEYCEQTRSKYRYDGPTELQAQMQFLKRIKREDLKSATSWHGLSIPERELQWGFLTTKVSTLKLEEKLHGESEVERVLNEIKSGNIATSSTQVWKCDGLRILDADEEDEIKPADYDERRDVKAALHKRKLEMEEEAAQESTKRTVSQYPPCRLVQLPMDASKTRHSGEQISSAHDPVSTQAKTLDFNNQKLRAKRLLQESIQDTKHAGRELMFGGFSATRALQRFMETRGKTVSSVKPDRVGLPTLSSHDQLTTKTAPAGLKGSSHRQTVTTLAEHSEEGLHKAGSKGRGNTVMTIPLPVLPSVPTDLKPSSFIISTRFLQQRALLRQIEQQYPKAEMVYRDYALPHSASNEADMILSPSTGLILTTLQQIKQRALPGRPERSPIKEHIATLQLRYERLLVLVSEGLSSGLEELGSSRLEDPRDREVLQEIEAFAAQMEGDVLVQYVRGGEKALVCSTVIEMAKYGLPHGSADIGDIKPIAQETTYEVFLRRAGLNPFAAQAIVALLKKPLSLEVGPSSSSPFPAEPKNIAVAGLGRFLMMSKKERIHAFQALMGGSRILRGVSDVLDQKWISAAHGFKI
ncbi:uncharacterized protein SETTUDRAFT_87328 [Exserohilum turcica Et28A]|uniref:Uncharacterized protein n=1 Tax=Exserohilum turcicum (strain 28A) TaxID=671987 RepID=R0KG43_EXST2|nr:uncharacterized protein SETTUDRAFT_87328 [Exserohilum turcica Et28A]EOA87042.1 hypothetical protein SETTUDRAFT_87328 [Exserohilum turcica Et28A]